MLGPLPTRPYEPQKYNPRGVVSDHMLRLFADVKPEYQTGRITTEDQATLSMILPDVMAELLAYRIAARRAALS